MIHSRYLFLAGLLLAGVCQGAEYTLANDTVRFHAPGDWVQIMQKTEGDPQFRAFQVRNPDAPNTLTRVSVNVRALQGTDAFDAYVKLESAEAAAQEGFTALPEHAPDQGKLRYSADEDGQRQVYRVDYFEREHAVTTLSCVRPENAPASEAWLAAYRLGCNTIAAELAQ